MALKQPTLRNALDYKKNSDALSMYSEDSTSGGSGFDVNSKDIVNHKVRSLGSKSPAERAKVGAQLGMGIGLRSGGLSGALIGASVGAMAGRSTGMIQAGEAEDNKRKEDIQKTLDMMGVDTKLPVNDKGTLDNAGLFSSKPTRDIYEVDDTNPFTNRSKAVVRPLAYFLTTGLLKHDNLTNPRDLKALDNATGVLVNSLQSGANSIDEVYTKAKGMAKKLGASKESLDTLLKNLAPKLSDTELKDLRKGINVLFR